MKRTRILILIGCMMLAACGVLRPQTSEGEGVEDASNQPGSSGAVEVIVEEVIVGQSAGGEVGPTTVEIVGGDEAALREFVTRWMGSSYPSQAADHITVYLGSLPPEMPYSLPLPDGARVIGSVRQTLFDFFQIILDAPMPVDAAAAFYEEALPDAGWEAASNVTSGGGFVSADYGLTYCLGQESYLTLQISPLAEEASDVRIFVQSAAAGYSPCNPGQGYEDPMSGQIPSLINPPGTTMTSGGGGGSSESDAYNETHLEGDVSAAEAAAHYNDQLTAAGWTLVESGSTDGLAWSTWTFSDAEGTAWTGTLFVNDIPPGSGKLFAYVRIALAP